ncbi:hypothetical protein ASH04_16135 [Rhodococcus sp. Leaf233]|nr:hypothetical protein ASH04_16135 [Rhodococcus sp. Leaf233]
MIPFDHANPLGGWTTVNNFQCLCEYHHSVKTAGYTSPPNPDDPASSPSPTHPTPEPSDEEADTAPPF